MNPTAYKFTRSRQDVLSRLLRALFGINRTETWVIDRARFEPGGINYMRKL